MNPRAGMTSTIKPPLCYRSKVTHLSRPWSPTLSLSLSQPCKTFFFNQRSGCIIWVDGKHWNSFSKKLCFRQAWEGVLLEYRHIYHLRLIVTIIACCKTIYTNSTFLLPPSSISPLPLFIPVQALECYKCDIGFWKLCLTSKTTCKAGEHCYSGVGMAGKELRSKKSHQTTFSYRKVVIDTYMKPHQLHSQNVCVTALNNLALVKVVSSNGWDEDILLCQNHCII